jgi:hypothetical protein
VDRSGAAGGAGLPVRAVRIPRNGDELVYANIARLTAASGHWLPQSAWTSCATPNRHCCSGRPWWRRLGDHWTLLNLRLAQHRLHLGTTLVAPDLKTVRGDAPSADAHGSAAAQAATAAGPCGAIAVYLSFFTTTTAAGPT